MYADRLESGTKRSIKDRLDGDLDVNLGRSRPVNGKRQRRSDDKWKHYLHADGGRPQKASKIGAGDLRLKLQKSSTLQVRQGGRELGGRVHREKLLGTMQAQVQKKNSPKVQQGGRELGEKLSGAVQSLQSKPTGTDRSKVKATSESAKPVEEKVPRIEGTLLPNSKEISVPTSKKKSQKKSDLSVHDLLKSLGLEKYSITFQAEEVDMIALRHMSDKDLKTLGIPMGPRKKILSALDSKA